MERVSVVVPLYNTEAYVEACLKSLLAQTHTELEIVVADDGSTDGSAAIVKRLAEADGRIVYLYQENAGVSAARNTALAAATGEYVCFADSDDVLEPNHIEILLRAMKESGAQLSSVRHIYEFSGMHKPVKGQKPFAYRVLDREQATKELFIDRIFDCTVTSKLMRRDLIGEQRFPLHTNHGEDLYFLYEYLKKVTAVAVTNQRTYHYIQHPKSIVNGRFKPSRMILLDTLNEVAADVERELPGAYPYAMGWIFLVHIEMLHFMKKWRYKDKALKKTLQAGLKAHYPYNKKVRKDYVSYRRVAHWIYPLFRIF